MLNLSDDVKIMLDIEVDSESEDIFVPEGLFSLTQKEVLKEVNFHNILDIGLEDYTKKVVLNIGMFNSLIHEWWNKTPVKRFDNSNPLNYIISYLKSINNIVESGRDTSYFSYFDELAAFYSSSWMNSLNIPFSAHPLELENNLAPEFSWMVEDFLVCLTEHRRSKYTEQIMKIINKNVEEMNFYQKKFQSISGESFIDYGVKLTTSKNSDILFGITDLVKELDKEQAILYFQSPFVFHKFDTNYQHIKWCLKQYRGKING